MSEPVSQSTRHIPDDVGDCPHWCPACLRERREREAAAKRGEWPTITGTMIPAAVDEVLRDMPTRELVERTVAAERARIVAWLRIEWRRYAKAKDLVGALALQEAAAAIERGRHANQ